MRREAVIAVFVAIAVAASAACSSSSSPKVDQTQAVGTSAPSAASPAASPPASPASIPTIDPETLDLQLTKDPFNRFEVDVPAGWTSEDPGVPGGFAWRWVLTVRGARVVQLMVRCEEQRSIDDMMAEDAAVVNGRGGRYDLPGTDVVAGDFNGKQLDYTVTIGGTVIESRVAYLADTPCGWRVLLQGFGVGSRDLYAALFQQAVASFHPLP